MSLQELTRVEVDSTDSLENIETKWKAEIEENCPGVKLVLVALKCDLRESHQDEEYGSNEPKRPMIQYQQGLEVAQRIKALRYLGLFSTLLRRRIIEAEVDLQSAPQ